MDVLLVKPYNLGDHIQPPLGLGYLATAIRQEHKVGLIDCVKERIKSPVGLIELVKRRNPDVLGIQCYTFHLDFIKEVFREIKQYSRDIICIVGGPHPSALPNDAMEKLAPEIDFAFQGEAENGLSVLLKLLSKGNSNYESVPGLIWKQNGKIEVNPRAVVENLDLLGLPAWDLLRPDKYPESQHGAFYRRFPIAPIIVTRGCPYPCTFCSASKISGKKIRKHSIGYILDEIKMLYTQYGIREFHIIDDNFTFDINYAKNLLRGLIAMGLDISWATPNGVRINRLDEELLDLMKRSGLYLISLGIESGSDRILKLMRKGNTVADIKKGINMIRRAGIDIAGFFIIGFPGETKEDIEKTINLACDLDLIRANFFTYLPFPATESFEELKKNGELNNVDWNNFYFTSAPYVPHSFSRKELKKYQRKAFFRFFLRPSIFIKNVMQIKSFKHFKFIFSRFYHWIIKDW